MMGECGMRGHGRGTQGHNGRVWHEGTRQGDTK